jgi:hypothetical protein
MKTIYRATGFRRVFIVSRARIDYRSRGALRFVARGNLSVLQNVTRRPRAVRDRNNSKNHNVFCAITDSNCDGMKTVRGRPDRDFARSFVDDGLTRFRQDCDSFSFALFPPILLPCLHHVRNPHAYFIPTSFVFRQGIRRRYGRDGHAELLTAEHIFADTTSTD